MSVVAGFLKMFPYLKYMEIHYPSRLQLLLDNMNTTFVSFSFGIIMPDDLQNAFPQRPLPDNFAKYGLESSFMLNYWFTATSLLLVLGMVIFLEIIIIIFQKCPNAREIFQRLLIVFKWNFFLMLFCTNLDGAVLGASLELRSVVFDSPAAIMSFLFCIIMSISALLCFWLMIHVVRQLQKYKQMVHIVHARMSAKKPIRNPELTWKCVQLFYKGSKDDSFITHIFVFPYFLRFYLFYTIIGYLFDHPVVQTMLFMTFNITLLSYMLISKPFVSKFVLLQHCSDEISMSISNFCIMILALLDHFKSGSVDFRDALGDVIIYSNVAYSVLAYIYLLGYLYLGFKAAYKATKKHKSKGLVMWIVAFLAPYESAGMDVDVVAAEETGDKATKTTTVQNSRHSMVRKMFQLSKMNMNTKEIFMHELETDQGSVNFGKGNLDPSISRMSQIFMSPIEPLIRSSRDSSAFSFRSARKATNNRDSVDETPQINFPVVDSPENQGAKKTRKEKRNLGIKRRRDLVLHNTTTEDDFTVQDLQSIKFGLREIINS